MTELKDLIAKLEFATEGSRELDCDIREALNWPAFADHNGAVRYFTTSIDAALTLVPEGRIWSIGCVSKGGRYVAVLNRDGNKSHRADTPALAICIAALRAK